MTPDGRGGGLLEGQVALVVGAASGIGRGVTERFVGEGASVVALDLSGDALAELATTLGERVEAVAGDATRPEVARKGVAGAVGRFGRLDALVCCAGRFDFRAALGSMTPEQAALAFDEIFAVNVKTMVLAVHAAADELRRSRGSVVLTLSSAALYPEGAGVLYGASKWAARGLVPHLARELAPEVRVNGVAPGGTGRTSLGGLLALGQLQTVESVPGRERRIAEGNLLGVAPTPADHAGCYVFLASRRLSPLVTGTVIASDGGRGEPLGDPATSSEPARLKTSRAGGAPDHSGAPRARAGRPEER